MAGKYPSIPDPGTTPETQLAALRAMKNVLDLIVANSTGVTNAAGVGRSSNTFALADDVNNLVLSEAATRATQIEQTSTDINTTIDTVTQELNKDISDANAAAVKARTDALDALDKFETGSFDPAVTQINGRIDKSSAYMGLNEATWKIGDISFADNFQSLSTNYTNYTAKRDDKYFSGIEGSITAITKADGAIATAVSKLETKILVPSSRAPDEAALLTSVIFDERNSVTDANLRIATAQNVSNTVASLFDVAGKDGKSENGKVTAAVKVESDARVDALKNVTSQYTISVSAENNGTKSVTGLQLISDTSGGNKISAFNVQADYFNIYKPGYSMVPVMSVKPVNGVNQLAFNGNIIADGTINARSIIANSITAIGTVTAGYLSDNATISQAKFLIDLANKTITISD